MVGSLALRPHFDSVLIREPSHTLWLRLTVFRANLFRARPNSSPESYLLPTRPARRPAPYASDTSPGVTPPSGPHLISVCIQPSPWARRSVGAVERGGSRFLRPDPPPWRGRRGTGTFFTSCECSPSVTPTPYPRPFRPLFFFMLPWWPWHRSSWDPADFISLNVPSPVVCRMRPPDLACSWA